MIFSIRTTAVYKEIMTGKGENTLIPDGGKGNRVPEREFVLNY